MYALGSFRGFGIEIDQHQLQKKLFIKLTINGSK